jgi:hypothetical protein
MNSNKNIQNMLETVESIFNAAQTAVEAMQDGTRLQIKELAQVVGASVGLEPKQVLNFVNHYVHNTDIAYVTRGKNGGIIRGVKQAKVVKAKKVKTLPVVVAAPDADSSTVAV